MTLEEMGFLIAEDIGTDCLAYGVEWGELTLTIDALAVTRVLTYLRESDQLQFAQLIDICGVDYLGQRDLRFEVVYHLLSLVYNRRIRLKIGIEEGIPVPSVTSVYSSADWWEREVFDMYGIPFEDHPDLRRILTDYDFEGYPMRKDFPLTGYGEVRYDEDQKRVIYEPVNLPQAFRTFDFESPWEAMETAAMETAALGKKAS